MTIIIVFGPTALEIVSPALPWIIGIAIILGACALGIQALKELGKGLEATAKALSSPGKAWAEADPRGKAVFVLSVLFVVILASALAAHYWMKK